MTKTYSTVLADPPWNESGGGKIKRGADRHYPLMKEPEIKALMSEWLDQRVAENAHLYMWVTNNYLPHGLRVLEHLEFRYVTNVVWAKSRMGLGQYFRGQHELCLFAVRGKGFAVRKPVNNISSLIGRQLIKPERHSQKPLEAYEMIEARSEGPYLELFARKRREGWDALGNEV